MSEENVEVARRAMDAWDRDNLEAFLAELDPDIEWHTAIEGTVEGAETAFRGHDGRVKFGRTTAARCSAG
jgi:ketosteroid isomerase-like protein